MDHISVTRRSGINPAPRLGVVSGPARGITVLRRPRVALVITCGLLVAALSANWAPAHASPPPASSSARLSASWARTPPIPVRSSTARGDRRPTPPYTPPVDGTIVDHFRPPACRWCPGNRGIDYATQPGDPVRASGAGVVTFAGPIGADLYVTIEHRDGLRTSYAYLATISVTEGKFVSQGAVVGTANLALGAAAGAGRRGHLRLDGARSAPL